MRPVVILASLALASVSLQAQDDTLRVLRHMPGDTASVGSIVTVTFDRPVAGRLDATMDATRLLRIEPAVKGRTQWRDPITIRFLPDAPLPPGVAFTATVDTAFRAIDGSRLARPFRFAFRVSGPRLLARSFQDGGTLPLNGRISLLYSAPVDLDAMRRALRLDLGGCGGPNPVMRVVRQRPTAEGDPYHYSYAGGRDRDTTGDRFRRVVEIEPASPLPEDCSGYLVVPTTKDDARHGEAERWALNTAPSFRLVWDECGLSRCPLSGFSLRFTSTVKRKDLERHMRVVPAVPYELAGDAEQSAAWQVNLRLTPRTRYTVVLDAALRDIHGRVFQGPNKAVITTGDYTTAIGHARGTLTLPRSGSRTMPLRHVNVRTVRVWAWLIPDSLRTRALSALPRDLRDVLREIATVPESVTVTLEGGFNEERTSELARRGDLRPRPRRLRRSSQRSPVALRRCGGAERAHVRRDRPHVRRVAGRRRGSGVGLGAGRGEGRTTVRERRRSRALGVARCPGPDRGAR